MVIYCIETININKKLKVAVRTNFDGEDWRMEDTIVYLLENACNSIKYRLKSEVLNNITHDEKIEKTKAYGTLSVLWNYR